MAPKKQAQKSPSNAASTDAEKVQEALNHEHILPGTLLDVDDDGNVSLGPGYAGEFPLAIMPLYPGDPQELPFSSVTPDWSEYHKTVPNRLWPRLDPEYLSWLSRVSQAKENHWKKHGLYEMIMLSGVEFPNDKGLLYAASQFWSIRTNSFHFPVGMMGPTIHDICMITGLYAFGQEADALISCKIPNFVYPKLNKDRSYKAWVAQYCGQGDEVDETEHVAFLIYWLNKYFFCVSSGQITQDFTELARVLIQDVTYALAPLLLASLYRGMYHFVEKAFSFGAGPLWIVMIWLWIYFPKFGPTPRVLDDHTTFAQHYMHADNPSNTFEVCFKYFYTLGSIKKWLPYKTNNAPLDLQPLEICLGGEDPHADTVWKSILSSRDLLYGLSTNPNNHKCGVEFYNPAQLARQLGLVQSVPLPPYQSLNVDFKERPILAMADLCKARTESLLRRTKCVLRAFPENTSRTTWFAQWWKAYTNLAFSTPLEDVLAKIHPDQEPTKTGTTSITSSQKRKGKPYYSYSHLCLLHISYSSLFNSILQVLPKRALNLLQRKLDLWSQPLKKGALKETSQMW